MWLLIDSEETKPKCCSRNTLAGEAGQRFPQHFPLPGQRRSSFYCEFPFLKGFDHLGDFAISFVGETWKLARYRRDDSESEHIRKESGVSLFCISVIAISIALISAWKIEDSSESLSFIEKFLFSNQTPCPILLPCLEPSV